MGNQRQLFSWIEVKPQKRQLILRPSHIFWLEPRSPQFDRYQFYRYNLYNLGHWKKISLYSTHRPWQISIRYSFRQLKKHFCFCRCRRIHQTIWLERSSTQLCTLLNWKIKADSETRMEPKSPRQQSLSLHRNGAELCDFDGREVNNVFNLENHLFHCAS